MVKGSLLESHRCGFPCEKKRKNWGLSENGYTPKRSKTGTLIGKMIIPPWILDFNFGNAQFFGSFRWKPAVSESSLHQGTWDARSPPGTPRRDGTMASRRRSRWRVWERRCPVDWKGKDDNIEIYPLVNVHVDVENPPLKMGDHGFSTFMFVTPGIPRVSNYEMVWGYPMILMITTPLQNNRQKNEFFGRVTWNTKMVPNGPKMVNMEYKHMSHFGAISISENDPHLCWLPPEILPC